MKFKRHYTDNFGVYDDIEINTLEELLKFVKKQKYDVIISAPDKYNWNEGVRNSWVLEVYNYYRE